MGPAYEPGRYTTAAAGDAAMAAVVEGDTSLDPEKCRTMPSMRFHYSKAPKILTSIRINGSLRFMREERAKSFLAIVVTGERAYGNTLLLKR